MLERRKLSKFGRCANNCSGPEPGVTSYGELVFFETPSSNEKSAKNDDKMPVLSSTVTCRKCGESGHWTMQCPHSDQSLQHFGIILADIPKYSDLDDSVSQSNKYVPPSRRTRTDNTLNSDEPTQKTNIRISNLDENATSDDLRDLFESFGRVKNVRVISDRNTGLSRGFGYVDFEDETCAQAAMDKLQGHAYGHQILGLGWAKPKRRF